MKSLRTRLRVSQIASVVALLLLLWQYCIAVAPDAAPSKSDAESGTEGTQEALTRRANSWTYAPMGRHFVHLPMVQNRYPPVPDTPDLYPIDNSDQDNYFVVRWSSPKSANRFILQEATDAAFSDARRVYKDSGTAWTVPSPGKTPATYYYRVMARNKWGKSTWSAVQTATVYPLFVGLQVRWDGEGYIRGSEYFNVGWHYTRVLNGLTDPDTVRSHGHTWYDPNSQDWAPEIWDSYYSVSTGYFRSSSVPDDPAWKWGYYWKLPYDIQFSDGLEVLIDGQFFTVSGPHWGYTAFGQAVQFWELVNKHKFLFWDGGGDWKQVVHPGDITLRYDAGATRLLLHCDIFRRYRYQGELTGDTVQYIYNLTCSNSFPGIAVCPLATQAAVGLPSTPVDDPEKLLGVQPSMRLR